MRPNRTGWALVAFFAVGGIAFWVTIPGIWIGQIWVGVAALVGVGYLAMSKRADDAAALRATGIRGVAQVLEMTQTGTYVNQQPRVRLRLRIEAPGVETFEATQTYTVPLVALGALQPGRPLVVAIDPADHARFVIDWSGAVVVGAPPPAPASIADGDEDPATRLAKLTELRDRGAISAAEFEEHTRRILSDI